MSYLYTITNPDDIDYDVREDALRIFTDPEDTGNGYVIVPIEFVVEALVKCGYDICVTNKY